VNLSKSEEKKVRNIIEEGKRDKDSLDILKDLFVQSG